MKLPAEVDRQSFPRAPLAPKQRERIGLTEDDLDTLVLANKIEREIDQLRTMIIVQEELRKGVKKLCEPTPKQTNA